MLKLRERIIMVTEALNNSIFPYLLSVPDKNGNHLKWKEDGLFLRQANEDHWRNIGNLQSITTEGVDYMVYTKQETEEDKYRKYIAWSLHESILPFVQFIHIETEVADYWITKEYAYKVGGRRWDKGTNKEKKLVVPIRYWKVKMKNPKHQHLVDSLGYEWGILLNRLFQRNDFHQGMQQIELERMTSAVVPSPEETFLPLRVTPFTTVKAVMIGTQPYRSKQAGGIPYSIREDDFQIPESLQQMGRSLSHDLFDDQFQIFRKDLLLWASQGVLMLNQSMTLQIESKENHAAYWRAFILEIIQHLNTIKDRKIPFVLLTKLPNPIRSTINHPIIDVGDPLDSSFVSSKIFSRVNEYLTEDNVRIINW